MITVKVNFTEADLADLDRDAAIQGITRSELVRTRTLTRSSPDAVVLTTTAYHRLVADTLTYARGSIDRRLLESIVAFVVVRLLGSKPS